MEALGLLTQEHPLTVADVRERLTCHGRELAYTTVMTVLTRLHEKGLVRRQKEGRHYLYAPARGAGRASAGLVAKVHNALFRRERLGPLVALLNESDDLSEQELRELRALVDLKLREKREEKT